MARHRRRVAQGVYKDKYGLSATVKVGTGQDARQREKRFPFDTPLKEIRAWQDTTRADLRGSQPAPATAKGTLEADAKAYLATITFKASYKSQRSELGAWTALYGHLRRSQIDASHVRKARAQWAADGRSPKTINNRVQALTNLYRDLDGADAPKPTDGIEPMEVPPSPIALVPAAVFKTVAKNLTDAKTRARFMVIASTGARPSELKRAEPGDIDLAKRRWSIRTGKGGEQRIMWLNGDMLAAWQAFVKAEAWGAFDGSDYAKALYAAGWPKDVRPYQARHSVAIELGERGADLGDIQGTLGHKHITTTRKHYAHVLDSRLKRASEALEGRFGWKAPKAGRRTKAAT